MAHIVSTPQAPQVNILHLEPNNTSDSRKKGQPKGVDVMHRGVTNGEFLHIS